MRPTQRSNRRPQRRPYTQHAQRLHQMDNPSIRHRENVHHRRTESSPAAPLPPREVFGLLTSWCRNICVTIHSTSANGTAPVTGAGASHSALSQQLIPCCITARQPQL
ncbi:regulator of sigma E protease [Trypanosoma cruzi]|nr:regulator of sigma E protease [Trypanosoma cruzi]